MQRFEAYDKEQFMRFIRMGSEMMAAAKEGDLDTFRSLFVSAPDKEILYWHLVKSFKAAYKAKKVEILYFIIYDCDMPLNHEAFDSFLYSFIFNCHLAEKANEDLKKETN